MTDKRQQAPKRDRAEPERHAPATSKWEWAIGAAGLFLVVGVVGYLLYYEFTVDAEMPSIRVEVAAVDRTQGGHVVRFRARNLGGATAAALRIRGELRRGASVVEQREATLDYLPAFSERTGGLFFQEDPGGYELRVVPEGYGDP